MDFPSEYKYTKDHEWVLVVGNEATVGITEFAQSELGELVFVDLPSVGQAVEQNGALCVVESTKAASDVYAPISGIVAVVNEALQDEPGLVNTSPYGDGWMVKIRDFSQEEVSALMSADEYKALVGA